MFTQRHQKAGEPSGIDDRALRRYVPVLQLVTQKGPFLCKHSPEMK